LGPDVGARKEKATQKSLALKMRQKSKETGTNHMRQRDVDWVGWQNGRHDKSS